MLFINVYCGASENTSLESKACRILKPWTFISLNCLTGGADVCSPHVRLCLRITNYLRLELSFERFASLVLESSS